MVKPELKSQRLLSPTHDIRWHPTGHASHSALWIFRFVVSRFLSHGHKMPQVVWKMLENWGETKKTHCSGSHSAHCLFVLSMFDDTATADSLVARHRLLPIEGPRSSWWSNRLDLPHFALSAIPRGVKPPCHHGFEMGSLMGKGGKGVLTIQFSGAHGFHDFHGFPWTHSLMTSPPPLWP
jgi:hypothetical protein